MSNSFGHKFKITTAGESHGKSISVIVDGCPSGLELKVEDIQKELNRRKPKQKSKITSQRDESDQVKVESGLLDGITTGDPIQMWIENKSFDSSKYEKQEGIFRPGHADYTRWEKWKRINWYGGGRASGRETAVRVAAGAIAKKILELKSIKVIGYCLEIGGIKAKSIDYDEIEKNPVRCPDANAAMKMEKRALKVKEQGDSVGGLVEVIAKNVPPRLGEPVFDKLDAELAKALMSIGAVKAVEIGAGMKVKDMLGSECNDPMINVVGQIKFVSNNSGGILGGISNGEDIVARIYVKPTPSISKPQKTVDINKKERIIKIEGDHDACICPRIVPVAEAMVALVLVDYLLLDKGSRIEDILEKDKKE